MSDLETLKILLIEDNPADARLFIELLNEVEDSAFSLRWVETLAEGIEQLTENPDLVLLDLMLPDSAGLETFARLQAQEASFPIVVLSGLEDRDLAVTAVARGAQDFLVKGHLDGLSLARCMRFAIERSKRNRAEQALRIADEQFRLAREVQQQFFPSRDPVLPGFDISGASFPAHAAGGDYFDYLPMPEGRLGVVIGDVSGHGVGPALLMSEARAYLRAICELEDDVGRILTRMNRLLARGGSSGRFVTLCLARIDPGRRTMNYASAGHRCYLVGSEEVSRDLESTGLVLGVLPDSEIISSEEIELETGDVLLMATDGILEAAGANGELFGAVRADEIVREFRGEPARVILQKLHEAVLEFADVNEPRDDETAVVVKVIDPSAAAAQ